MAEQQPETLRVRLWIDHVLVADDRVSIEDADQMATRHALQAITAAHWRCVISDPDQDDALIAVFGNTPEGMKQPMLLFPKPN